MAKQTDRFVENDPDFVVISSYTDEQAVDDGVLVEMGDRNRATQAVFSWLKETVALPSWGVPPTNWPVELMMFCAAGRAIKAGTEGGARVKAEAAIRGLIGSCGPQARRIYEQNIGGGVWVRYYEPLAHALLQNDPKSDAKRLWMLPNEIGGMTLMFPEDY